MSPTQANWLDARDTDKSGNLATSRETAGVAWCGLRPSHHSKPDALSN
jgi:hypothetical protein